MADNKHKRARERKLSLKRYANRIALMYDPSNVDVYEKVVMSVRERFPNLRGTLVLLAAKVCDDKGLASSTLMCGGNNFLSTGKHGHSAPLFSHLLLPHAKTRILAC